MYCVSLILTKFISRFFPPIQKKIPAALSDQNFAFEEKAIFNLVLLNNYCLLPLSFAHNEKNFLRRVAVVNQLPSSQFSFHSTTCFQSYKQVAYVPAKTWESYMLFHTIKQAPSALTSSLNKSYE